ncbi:MAG: SMP-30/gluconolactonase/LRE family protein [Dehalococcoidia bacterium]
MDIQDDHGISKLLVGTERRLCTGFGFTEGPVWVASDGALLFSDIPGNRTHRWRPGMTEAETYRAPSGWANGLTLDAQGRVVACEHGGRRVSRHVYGQAEQTETLAGAWAGQPLNSPNDVVVHSSGAIFFTDPSYGVDRGNRPVPFGAVGQTQDLDFQGVYRIDPDGSVHLLAPEGFNQPNGLVFTPDESAIYINDSGDRVIWRYPVNADLSLGERTLFVDQRADPRTGNPDGMKVDTEGRLWTTGAGGVSVHTAEGEYLGCFEMDEHAANLTFGGDDFSTLFMTAATSVFAIETTVRGIAPGSR